LAEIGDFMRRESGGVADIVGDMFVAYDAILRNYVEEFSGAEATALMRASIADRRRRWPTLLWWHP
jgi:hypothetical protein